MKSKQRMLRATAIILLIGYGYTHTTLKDFYRTGIVSEPIHSVLTPDCNENHFNTMVSYVRTIVISEISKLFTAKSSQ